MNKVLIIIIIIGVISMFLLIISLVISDIMGHSDSKRLCEELGLTYAKSDCKTYSCYDIDVNGEVTSTKIFYKERWC